jgi:hypothetical protein
MRDEGRGTMYEQWPDCQAGPPARSRNDGKGDAVLHVCAEIEAAATGRDEAKKELSRTKDGRGADESRWRVG